MNRKIIITVLGTAGLMALMWLINGPLLDLKLEQKIREQMPRLSLLPAAGDASFVVYDSSGKALHLKDFQGTPLLLNFWASWCAPCVQELPELTALQAQYGTRLKVLAISVDAKGFETINTFLAQHPDLRPPPLYWDKDMKQFQHLKLTGLPTSFLLNREGQTIAKLERRLTADDPELRPLIERVVEETPSD